MVFSWSQWRASCAAAPKPLMATVGRHAGQERWGITAAYLTAARLTPAWLPCARKYYHEHNNQPAGDAVLWVRGSRTGRRRSDDPRTPPWAARRGRKERRHRGVARRGSARRYPPCAKPAEGALPDTEVGKGGRAVPDRGRSASHGKGDLPPRHRSVAKSSGEGGGAGGGGLAAAYSRAARSTSA